MKTGTTVAFEKKMIEFEEFNARVGLPEIRGAEEERYYGHLEDSHKRGS